jgi:hypothetical protein
VSIPRVPPALDQPPPAKTNSNHPVRLELDEQVSRDRQLQLDVHSHTVPKPSMRINSQSIEQKGIVASFIQDLFPIGQSTVQLSFIGSCLWHVPEALQRNHAMDLAAESLALVYFAKTAKSMETLMRSHWVYANALRALSIALQDSKSRFAFETLCATLLLIHYEV